MDHRERQELIEELERQQDALLEEISHLEAVVAEALSKVSAIQHSLKPHPVRRIDSAHGPSDTKRKRAA